MPSAADAENPSCSEQNVPTSHELYTNDQEPDVRELLNDMFCQRWRICLAVIMGLLLAIVYLHLARYEYSATLKIVPTSSAGSGLGSKFGGLASLAGVSLPGDLGNANFDQFVETIYSLDVASVLAKDQNLMQQIFPEQWDLRTKSWQPPQGMVHSLIRGLKSLLGVPTEQWTPPGSIQLQDYIAKYVTSTDKPKKALTTLEFSHPNRNFAAHFLLALESAADNQLRQRSLERTSVYINYLTQKLETVTVAEHRQALSELLSNQEKVRMVASSTASFAVEIIGEPVTPLKPSSPKPQVVLPAGVILGGLVPTIWIVISWYVREIRRTGTASGSSGAHGIPQNLRSKSQRTSV